MMIEKTCITCKYENEDQESPFSKVFRWCTLNPWRRGKRLKVCNKWEVNEKLV